VSSPHQVPLHPLNFPSLGFEVGLHRRGNTFHVILTRAYGIANGYKLWAQLNLPQPLDPSSDPPASHARLNPRIWLRDGSEWTSGNSKMTFEELMGTEPSIPKDSGLRRKVKTRGYHGEETEIEERLVEVLLKEEEYCQRCAWCGVWEDKFETLTRYRKAGNGKDGRPLYWCGVSYQKYVGFRRGVVC
jgi:hypothetical protein